MALTPGDTIHIPDTGPAHDKGKPHLFVALTTRCSKGMVLLVPLCTIRGKFDPACKVTKGEHGFAAADSYIAYYYINQFNAAALEKQLEQGILRSNDAVGPELLKRICDGVLNSSHTPPIEKKYYQTRLGDAAAKN